MSEHQLLQAFIALLACSSILFLAWLWALRLNFLSLVDAVWALSFTLVSLFYTFTSGSLPWKKIFFLALAIFWSLRLGTHLFHRLAQHFPQEDSRYTELKKKWGKNLRLQSFLFFQLQGISVVLLSLPFLFFLNSPESRFHTWEIVGSIIACIGMVGEAVADYELKQFKLDPKSAGKICKKGLWRYSRHPNYFFECVIWLGFALLALASPYGWLGFISPLIITLLILFVTGIPPAEEQALKKRKEAYREYQRTTSALIPWFPKGGENASF